MELLNAGVRIRGKNMVSYIASSLLHTVVSKNRAWKISL